jgi:hypothetical protein
MIPPVKFSIPQPVKTIFVPALGVGAVFADMEQQKGNHHKALRLGETLAAIASCVCLHRWQTGLLTLIGGITIWTRTKSKKTKEEKTKSVVKDIVWVGSGLLTQQLLSGKLNKAGERQWYLHNCCAFAIGALLVAPLINRLIFGKEPQHNEDSFAKSHNTRNSPVYPTSFYKTGLLIDPNNQSH